MWPRFVCDSEIPTYSKQFRSRSCTEQRFNFIFNGSERVRAGNDGSIKLDNKASEKFLEVNNRREWFDEYILVAIISNPVYPVVNDLVASFIFTTTECFLVLII